MGYKSIKEILSAGLSPDALEKALLAFNASTNEASRKSASIPKSSGGDDSSELEMNIGSTKAKATGLSGIFDDATNAIVQMGKALNPADFSGADYLMRSGQELANAMGIGKARIGEMRTTIADAIPEMLKLGMSTTDAFKVLEDVPTSLGVNTTMSTEALREMGAAAQVSKVNAGELAKEFKGVGMSLYDVGDRMAEVANYAKSVGVNVGAVSKSVVDNLYKMNLYNFDNGVKGLAKMAANAASMGVTMEHVQTVTDKVFNPEGAIEMAAGLQRLGVSSSALLDPLKAMDLSMNDPEQLQKEIGNIAKEFSSFNKETGKFEIMPGSKRRLMEVAKEMGIPAKELANMSIKASEFDMKMSKIKFPSLAASEEDKTLIANMSQMKGGEAFVQIKNDTTGKMDEINVSKLTADQITKLKEQQADGNKTIEELAVDQLNVLQSIDAKTGSAVVATQFGKATAPAMDRFYNTMNVVREESVKMVTTGVNTGNVREAVGGVTQPLEQGVIDFLSGKGSIETLNNTLTSLTNNITTTLKEITKGAAGNLMDATQNTVNQVTKIYGPAGVTPTDIKIDENHPYYKKLDELLTKIVGEPKETKTQTQVSGDVKHTVVFEGTGMNAQEEESWNKYMNKFLQDPNKKASFEKWTSTSNEGLLTK
jgi:hypothetical protein